jgi:hypothetical protein
MYIPPTVPLPWQFLIINDNFPFQSTAQFTFDVEPGVGIYEDKPLEYEQPLETKSLSELQPQSKPDLSPVTYEGLANYLDYELPQQRLAQSTPIQPSLHTQQPLLQPRPVANTKPTMPVLAPRIAPAPPADGSAPFNAANFSANFGVPMIYPKPSSTDDKPAAGLKRKATDSGKASEKSTSTDPNLDSKSASEEDKRRRNTAASARFRVKKKMREQALEQTAKEMTEKAEKLEGRVKELELEVKWLRSILIEKESRTSDAPDAPKQDVKAE